jgi:PPE-repeat protein
MAAPVWIASPPEVHSALLSSGPGPGPLLAAAGAWSSLSTEYTSAAAELTTLLGAVHTGAWQGPSAEQYVAAHTPYLSWLTQAGADSAEVAAQHEVAATGYSAALATMPTLAELAANHMIHGVLVATNFFGINTIPIALNEADYVRMWVQAATTMSTYHTVSGAALASAPRTASAPMVLKTNSAAATSNPPPSGSGFSQIMNQLQQLFQNPSGTLSQIIAGFSTNPVAAMVAYGPTLFLAGFAVYEVVSPFTNLAYIGIVLPVIAAIVNAAAGPAELAAEPNTPGPQPVLASTEQPKAAQHPAVAAAPTIATPGAPAAPASVSGPAAGAGAAASPATVGFGYMVGGISGPDAGAGPTLHDRSGERGRAVGAPVAAAVRTPARERTRARRRRRAKMKGFADEFMDMNIDVDPDWGTPEQPAATAEASESGANALGFTGTSGKAGAWKATGLTTLAGDGFGGGLRAPMLPESWADRESELPGSEQEPESE